MERINQIVNILSCLLNGIAASREELDDKLRVQLMKMPMYQDLTDEDIDKIIYFYELKYGSKTKEKKEMTKGIRKMEAMGFTVSKISEDQFNRGLVRQFVKYDHKDRVTDIINFYYSKSVGVEVYANSLKYGCGSRLDTELLNVIQLNCEELKEKENELE